MSLTEQPTATPRSDASAGEQGRARRHRPGSRVAPIALAGLLLLVAVYTVLGDQDVTHRVAVAARDLQPGVTVSADSFRITESKLAEDLVGGLVHAEHLADTDGWVVASSVAAGEPVPRSALRPPSAPDELRAVSLPIDRERAVGGDLSRGDRVDVIAVVDGHAAYVAADLAVLAVAGRGEGALSGPTRYHVTVAVDEVTALALARAFEVGAVTIARSTGSRPASVDRAALDDAGLREHGGGGE